MPIFYVICATLVWAKIFYTGATECAERSFIALELVINTRDSMSLMSSADKNGNIIHPTTLVGPKVRLGRGNYIGPYCTFTGDVEIGDNNYFVSHVSVGSPAEHKGFKFNPQDIESMGKIVIGSNNKFFEFVSINHPYFALTSIGSGCFILASVYLPHDCVLEDNVTISNHCAIGGHSVLMKGCNIGFSTCVHQFSVIGSYAMIGMGSVVLKDIPPFGVYVGTGPERKKINKVGMVRAGYAEAQIKLLEQWNYPESLEGLTDEGLAEEMKRFKQYVAKTTV